MPSGCRSTRSTRSSTMRACSAGNSSFQSGSNSRRAPRTSLSANCPRSRANYRLAPANFDWTFGSVDAKGRPPMRWSRPHASLSPRPTRIRPSTPSFAGSGGRSAKEAFPTVAPIPPRERIENRWFPLEFSSACLALNGVGSVKQHIEGTTACGAKRPFVEKPTSAKRHERTCESV
jgi:hypothetical protein